MSEAFERLKSAFAGAPIAPEQWSLIEQMSVLHREWNAKINLVSRKDIENLEWHHYAPCLAAVQFLRLMAGARVIDVGTGGGFPGLLLAVLYPQAQFTLMDSVAKKILVVSDIAQKLKLANLEARVGRVEKLNKTFDFVTGRAVTNLPQFFGLVRKLLRAGKKNSLVNGILYWKGGELDAETQTLGVVPEKTFPLETLLDDSFFSGKYILHYPYGDVFRAKKTLSSPC